MRLDKYLKLTRLIKRRTVANEACDADRASLAVKEGDIIEINLGSRPLRVKVLKVSEYVTKDDAPTCYQILE